LIISKKYNVGIDILEKNRQIKNFNLIIKDWNEKPKTNKKFIKLWTIKESVIKIYSNNTLRNINNVNVFKKFCIYNKQKIYYKTIKNKHIICTYSYFKK
jgi:phosphopantetheinyl transferase